MLLGPALGNCFLSAMDLDINLLKSIKNSKAILLLIRPLGDATLHYFLLYNALLEILCSLRTVKYNTMDKILRNVNQVVSTKWIKG